MRAVVIVWAFALAGCATSYQPEGATGGFSDSAVSSSIRSVQVAANVYSTADRTRKMALLRAGELTREAGFDRFRIIGGTGVRPTPPYGLGYQADFTIKFVGKGEASDADTFRVEDVERYRSEVSAS